MAQVPKGTELLEPASPANYGSSGGTQGPPLPVTLPCGGHPGPVPTPGHLPSSGAAISSYLYSRYVEHQDAGWGLGADAGQQRLQVMLPPSHPLILSHVHCEGKKPRRVQPFRFQFNEKYPQTTNTLPTGLGSPSSQRTPPAKAGHFPPRPEPAKGACGKGSPSRLQRPSLREELENTSCYRNPAGLLPSKPLLANSPLLKKKTRKKEKRLDKQSNPHAQPGAIPKILGVFLVCKI